MKLEVIVSSYEDAAIANNIVDNILLCTATNLMGLTANISTLKMIKRDFNLKVSGLVRVRGAGFNYTDLEFAEMKEQVKDLIANKVDSLVFGILNDNFEIDKIRVKEIVDLAKANQVKIYFSSAFDLVNDVDKAMDDLIELGFDGVKTRGLNSDIELGLIKLTELNQKYQDKLEIIATGNINYTNIEEIAMQTGIRSMTVNASIRNEDHTTVNNGIDFSYLRENQYEKISPYMLNRMKFILDNSLFLKD